MHDLLERGPRGLGRLLALGGLRGLRLAAGVLSRLLHLHVLALVDCASGKGELRRAQQLQLLLDPKTY